ncbi:B12-binding domain-containing radical SAM protein [Desulfitobacterium sp. PCE1]|uniref:B12-binding domain-containing radical SAM protein n=1 Tax=Desulfitobacterium sp. PCE1 TaxID=146907 RepID=UPI00035DBA37|nr:radical SAM protein [Desulfitobacterium sp. PCE1]
MRIVLIQPKMNKRPMDTDLKTRMAPPLSLLTLMSLTPEGHEVIMVNENVEKIDYHCGAEMVGITITLDVMPRAAEIAKKFRRLGIPVVAGGIHVTSSPDECSGYFDAVCIGAAERVWASMIEDAARGRLQQVYHDMADFRGDEIVPPAYNRIDKSRYLYTNVITTSRGCPNRCDFCYNSCQNRMYIRRPVEDVLRDIEFLGTRHILFIDDNFIGVPSYTRELLNKLRGMDLKWSAAVTTKIADHPDLLDLMAETGCQSLFIGFESINNSSLHGVNKDNHFEKYEKLAAEIHSRGIMINASMVFGLDGDEPDVFQRTLDWLVKNKIETLTSHILTPYPGTELYRRMKDEGRITDHELSKYNTAHVVFQPKGMTAEELYEGYLWIYREFYSFPNILRRMPEHRAQRKSYLLFNIFYRKLGRFTSALARIVPMGAVGRLAARISYRVK